MPAHDGSRIGAPRASSRCCAAPGRIAWKPCEIGGRRGGSEVYRAEAIELRSGDRILWTRYDDGLGLFNSRTAEVAEIKDRQVTFLLEDGQQLGLGTGELRALFVDQNGADLRNQIAHGLMWQEQFFHHASIYAWWFVFHLTICPVRERFLNTDEAADEGADGSEPDGSNGE